MFQESLLSLGGCNHVSVSSAFMGSNTELQFWGAVTMEAMLATGSADFVAGCLAGWCLLVKAWLS